MYEKYIKWAMYNHKAIHILLGSYDTTFFVEIENSFLVQEMKLFFSVKNWYHMILEKAFFL